MNDTTRPFGSATAEFILGMLDWKKALELRDEGLYIAEAFRDSSIGTERLPARLAGVVLLDWTFAEDMDWKGAPDPLEAPALPIPFSAAELAAFMLDGPGRSLQDRFGPLGQSLDAQRLSWLDPARERRVVQALTDAFADAQAAQTVVGAPPEPCAMNEDAEAREPSAYALRYVAWRKAMVRHLLRQQWLVALHRERETRVEFGASKEPRQYHPLNDLLAQSIRGFEQRSRWQAGWIEMKKFARTCIAPMRGLREGEIEYLASNGRVKTYSSDSYRKWFDRSWTQDNSDNSTDNSDNSPTE